MAVSILRGIPFLLMMFGMGNTNSIAVMQHNDKTQIVLDGVHIDLSKARVEEEDLFKVVLIPLEVQGARITMYKGEKGKLSIDYNGQHYESMRPEDINNIIQGNMAEMNAQMEQLRQQMQNMRKNMLEHFKMPFMGAGFDLPMMGGLF